MYPTKYEVKKRNGKKQHGTYWRGTHADKLRRARKANKRARARAKARRVKREAFPVGLAILMFAAAIAAYFFGK